MRPARLIEIKLLDNLQGKPEVRLIETTPGQIHEYVCLSHRWDEDVKRSKTTLQNMAERRRSIDLAGLPGNFRDFVVIARELGIRHIWIDSICIIQGGDNGHDLAREIAKMGFIYQNAQFVVAAVSSPDSRMGCFINDKWPDKCFKVEDLNGQTHIIGARILNGKGQFFLITFSSTKRENPYQSRNRPEIYARRVDHSMSCITDVKELDVSGVLMELQLDANTAREDVSSVLFTGCVNTGKSTCALAEIYLLHALHKEKPSRSLDAFLVLQKIEPTFEKPNCYKRIGLWKLTDNDGTGRSWAHIVRGRIKPRVEELWLF
ncbi:hypothetical protein SLS61_005880 [Didymella pomorum]